MNKKFDQYKKNLNNDRKKIPQQRREIKGGENTLEKNINNINTDKFDLEFEVDPLFKKTTARFDESNAKGLLLNNIFVDIFFIFL